MSLIQRRSASAFEIVDHYIEEDGLNERAPFLQQWSQESGDRSSTVPMSGASGAFQGDVDDRTLVDIDASPDTSPGKSPFKEKTGVHSSPMSNAVSPTQFNIVTLNLSGLRFQTHLETLARYPNTLLGNPRRRAQYYNPATEEYFFDRHRASFESILYIYQSNGRVKRPDTVPVDIYIGELKFFEMGDELMEAFWISEGYEKPEEVPMPENKQMRRVWKLMEFPDSSLAARVIAFVSVFVIVLSIMSFCIETIPELGDPYINRTGADGELISKWNNPFFCIEFLCILWFTIEFLLRFMSCPSKAAFVKSFLNIIDVVAIVPFYINQIMGEGEGSGEDTGAMSFAVLRVLRLVRVFRIFKLSRHSVGLQILGKTFHASIQEFCLLIFFMIIAIVLFGSGIYFAEGGENKFTSIPASFWYALVTMTTVGYGDMYPITTYGQIVGACCALIGVLTLALPVPIIVANFKHFYRQETRLAQMKNDDDDYQDDGGNSDSS